MEYKGALTASLGTYAFQLQDAFYINKKTSPCKAEPYLPLQGWMWIIFWSKMFSYKDFIVDTNGKRMPN